MSVQLLRDGAVSDIQERIAEYTAYLTDRTDDLDTVRRYQGIIVGLKLAIDAVDHRANNLHSQDAPWR